MPKDFVGRLLNLENSLKTVISICDVSNNERNSKMQKMATASYRRCPSTCECSLRKGNRNSETEQHRAPQFTKPVSAPRLSTEIKKFDSESISNNKRSPKKTDETEHPRNAEFFQYSINNFNWRNHANTGDDTRYRNENLSGTRSEVCYKKHTEHCICRGGSSRGIQKSNPDSSGGRERDEGNKPLTRRVKHNVRGNNDTIDAVKSAPKMEKGETETKFPFQRVFRWPGHALTAEDYIEAGEFFPKTPGGNILVNGGRPATAPADPSPNFSSRPPHYHRNTRKWKSSESKTNMETDSKGNLDRIAEEQSSDTCEKNSDAHPPSDLDEIASSRGSQGENLTDDREDFVGIEEKKIFSDATSREIAKIIEKNHEKIEKMRKSKLEALNKVKIMKERYDGMLATKTQLSGKIQELIEKNERLMEELREMERSKGHVVQEFENYKKRCTSFTSDKAQSTNREELKAPEGEKIARKEDKGSRSGEKIGEINGDVCYEYHVLLRKQQVAYRRLVQGIVVLEKVIQNNKEKQKRLSEMKAELKKRTSKTQAYLDRITSEKIDLTNLVNKLRAFAEEQQSKIDRLQQAIKEKEEELVKQKQLLLEKSESLEETNKEMESIRKNSSDLEEQVRTLRKSVENFDKMHENLLKERESFQETFRRIQCENDRLQEEITNEKDSILIKNKIIQDQQETIKQLKEKSDEVKTLARKVESLERLINVERGENLQLQESVQRLKRKKEELKEKVKSLEADLLLAPQEVVRDLQKTQIVLHQLENQVQLKQKEWEMLLQSLVNEKEQACNFAAFATKKLMETTSDFQKQSDTQKKLYKILTENIIKKKKTHFQAFAEKGVKFSEDTQEKFELSDREIEREERENSAEMHRYLNRLAIPRDDNESFFKNQYLPECYSNIKFNESGDIEPENEYLRQHCGI